MAEEIAAHERYLRVLSDWNDARDHGDGAAVRKLQPQLLRAKREWHQLVRAAEDATRNTRRR